MDITKFAKFDQICANELSVEIDKILREAKGKEMCAVAFITTDDFYGFYLSWDYSNHINEYYDWQNGLEPDFLY